MTVREEAERMAREAEAAAPCGYPCVSIIADVLTPILTENQRMKEAQAWRTMDSALRDGTRIMVYRPIANEFIRYVGIDVWKEVLGVFCWANSNDSTKPTHWQPLPSGPGNIK